MNNGYESIATLILTSRTRRGWKRCLDILSRQTSSKAQSQLSNYPFNFSEPSPEDASKPAILITVIAQSCRFRWFGNRIKAGGSRHHWLNRWVVANSPLYLDTRHQVCWAARNHSRWVRYDFKWLFYTSNSNPVHPVPPAREYSVSLHPFLRCQYNRVLRRLSFNSSNDIVDSECDLWNQSGRCIRTVLHLIGFNVLLAQHDDSPYRSFLSWLSAFAVPHWVVPCNYSSNIYLSPLTHAI